MAILVDEAIWPWRGARWAHLVSDRHLDELHDFAHRIGMPYLAFQGDHYDIHSRLRQHALAVGARAVPGRELVAALRDAGLRRRGRVEPWQWHWRREADDVRPTLLPSAISDQVVESVATLRSQVRSVEVGVAERSDEMLVVVTSDVAVAVEPGLERVDASLRVHRSSGERGTFLEWQMRIGPAGQLR
jgi:hypothetical protein